MLGLTNANPTAFIRSYKYSVGFIILPSQIIVPAIAVYLHASSDNLSWLWPPLSRTRTAAFGDYASAHIIDHACMLAPTIFPGIGHLCYEHEAIPWGCSCVQCSVSFTCLNLKGLLKSRSRCSDILLTLNRSSFHTMTPLSLLTAVACLAALAQSGCPPPSCPDTSNVNTPRCQQESECLVDSNKNCVLFTAITNG